MCAGVGVRRISYMFSHQPVRGIWWGSPLSVRVKGVPGRTGLGKVRV
jgi:hypothetical protein